MSSDFVDQDKPRVGAPDERTQVRLNWGDTFWHLAEVKYNGRHPIKAILEANHLSGTVGQRNGKEELIAETYYAGKTYVLPAAREIPRLTRQFDQHNGGGTWNAPPSNDRTPPQQDRPSWPNPDPDNPLLNPYIHPPIELPPGWWWKDGKPVPPSPEPTTPEKPAPTTPEKPAPTTPEKPAPTTPDKPGPTDKPNSLISVVEALEKQHQTLDKSFQQESGHEGFIGSLVDGAKNYLGSTSENRDWCNPKALWSHVLDYNSGSQHTGQQLNREADGLKQLRQAAEKNDVPAFSAKYKELTGKEFDPKSIDAAKLKADGDTKRFHQSQANGVEFVTDLGAGAVAGVAALRTGGLSLAAPLLFGAAAGSITKAGLKQADGQYANLRNDLLTGGLVGLAVPTGEFAGAAASRAIGAKLGLTVTGEGLAARIETQGLGLGNRVLSASAKAGTAGATYGAIDSPMREVLAAHDEGRSVTVGDLTTRTLAGAAFGFVGGTILGLAFDGAADGFKRNNPEPIKPIAPKEINGVQIPSSNVVTMDQAAKIMGYDPAAFAKIATDDPYAATKLAAQLFKKHGVNIQRFSPETGKVAVPSGFADALGNAQAVDALTADSALPLARKVDAVRAADNYLQRNSAEVNESLRRIRSDMNYKEVLYQKAQEGGDAARNFEDKFTDGFKRDLTVRSAVERIKNGGSQADAFTRAKNSTEDAYVAKANDYFLDIADPARRARLNDLVEQVYQKFTPEYLTRQQVSDIISAFPEEDRSLAQAFMMRSASNSSDVGLRVKLQQIRPEVKAQLGTSAPDNVFTLGADSSGNAVGYLYRKSNSLGMSMRNIDQLAGGPLPDSIVLFDDLSTVRLPESAKMPLPIKSNAEAAFNPKAPIEHEFAFEKTLPPELPTGSAALARIDGTLTEMVKGGEVSELQATMMRSQLERNEHFVKAANIASLSPSAIDKLLAALRVPQRSPYEGIPAAQAQPLNLSKPQLDLLRKIPNVYVVDLNAFEKGINVVDLARGPEAVTAKLKALVAEAKQNGTAKLLAPGVVQETLDGSVDRAAAAIGANVKIIRAPDNYQMSNAPSQAELAAMDPVDAIHKQLTIPKTTRSEIAGFLSDYAGQDRELAAQMLANGAVNNSFSVMARKSIDVNNQIQQILRQNKGALNDLSIVTDIDPGGSTHLISYYLGRVAGLPSDNFISTKALNRMVVDGAAKDKFLARLDDTVYSGDQTVSALNSNISGFMPFKKVVIGTLGAYDKGINKIENTHLGYLGKVATAYSERYHPFYSPANPFYGPLSLSQRARVESIGGYSGWGKVQGSLVWPYMYPDNNVDFFGPKFSGTVLHLPGP
ncbi:MAG TPA: hypothetical protein V6D22_06395 [Candidatus Obscuribacterales bacterium]